MQEGENSLGGKGRNRVKLVISKRVDSKGDSKYEFGSEPHRKSRKRLRNEPLSEIIKLCLSSIVELVIEILLPGIDLDKLNGIIHLVSSLHALVSGFHAILLVNCCKLANQGVQKRR